MKIKKTCYENVRYFLGDTLKTTILLLQEVLSKGPHGKNYFATLLHKINLLGFNKSNSMLSNNRFISVRLGQVGPA